MADRIRVALVDHTARLGGAEISLLQLACRLDPETVELTVVLGEEGPLGERLRAQGVDVVMCPFGTLGDRRKDSLVAARLFDPRLARTVADRVSALRTLFREREFDVVHTNTLKAHVTAGLAGRLAGAHVVWHLRDHLQEPYLPVAAVRAMRALARVVPHLVVAVSQSAARTVGRADVRVLHHGVSLPELSGHAARAATPLRVGLVGRMAPWKGQDVFLDAAERIAAGREDVEFVLAGSPLFGEDEFECDLKLRASRAPLAGRVHFLGFCDDVWSVYRSLDVAVHASTMAEPYGNVVLEAMASRTALVAAAAGGVLELVDDGCTGVLVRPGDAAALAGAISALLDDPVRRARLARAGRESVERRFTPAAEVRALERIYVGLAA